jgi:hypothetical protein
MKMAGINPQSRSGNPKEAMNGLIGSNRFGALDSFVYTNLLVNLGGRNYKMLLPSDLSMP